MAARSALLIANFDYQDPALGRLLAPANDVQALAAVLRDRRIADFEVTILVNEPHHRVGQAIGEFYRERHSDDLLLLYFTGHGLRDEEGRLHLAAADTRLDNLFFTAVSADNLDRAMESCLSRRKVLILDCCYSGAFPRGWVRKGTADVHAIEKLQGRGRSVLTASDAAQYSFEGEVVDGEPVRSVFTKHLVAGLRDGSADLDGDGDVALDELYSYVYDRVVAEIPQQRPKKQDDIEGRIVLARNVNWRLPAYLREALDNPIASIRLRALDEVGRFLRTGNETVRQVVDHEVRQLLDDDSRSVSAAAARLLEVVEPVGSVASPNSIPAARPVKPERPVEPERPVASPPGPAQPAPRPPRREGASPSKWLSPPAERRPAAAKANRPGLPSPRVVAGVGLLLLTAGLALPWASYGGPVPPFSVLEVQGDSDVWILSVVVVVAASVAGRLSRSDQRKSLLGMVGVAAVVAMLWEVLPLLTGHRSIFALTTLTTRPDVRPVDLLTVLMAPVGAALISATAWARPGRWDEAPPGLPEVASRAVAGAAGVLALVNFVILLVGISGGQDRWNSAPNPFLKDDVQVLRPWTYALASVAFLAVAVDLVLRRPVVRSPVRWWSRWLRSVRLTIVLSYAVTLGDGGAYLYWIADSLPSLKVPLVAVLPALLLAVALA